MSIRTAAFRRFRQAVRLAESRINPVSPPRADVGEGIAAALGHTLDGQGCRRPLVVLGAGSGPVRGGVTEALTAAGLNIAVWDELPDRPTDADADDLALFYQAERCDAFVAVGTGRAIDAAKLAAARVALPGRTVAATRGRVRLHGRKTPPVIAVPVVPGDGAETMGRVFLTDRHGAVVSAEGPALRPTLVVADPALTARAERPLLAQAAAEGLCMAWEADISIFADAAARTAAAAAVRGLLESAEPCWNTGGTAAQRSVLLEASRSVGEAVTVAGVGPVTALCEVLEGECGIPRGEACGAVLPAFMEKYGYYNRDPLAAVAAACGMDTGTRAERVAALIERIRRTLFCLGLPEHIDGIQRSRFESIAARAADAAKRTGCPFDVLAADYMELLQAVCETQYSR